MLFEITLPHEPFNTYVRDGSAGQKMGQILETTKPEAAYFTERDGCRSGLLIYNVEDPSRVPFFSEPWFLLFNADIRIRIVMTPQDLAKAGLEELGKKWG